LGLVSQDVSEVLQGDFVRGLIPVSLGDLHEDLLVAWSDLAQIQVLENRLESFYGQVVLLAVTKKELEGLLDSVKLLNLRPRQ
jgi:hypothetical protein